MHEARKSRSLIHEISTWGCYGRGRKIKVWGSGFNLKGVRVTLVNTRGTAARARAFSWKILAGILFRLFYWGHLSFLLAKILIVKDPCLVSPSGGLNQILFQKCFNRAAGVVFEHRRRGRHGLKNGCPQGGMYMRGLHNCRCRHKRTILSDSSSSPPSLTSEESSVTIGHKSSTGVRVS